MAALTQDELARYHDAGYVVPAFRLTAEHLSELREALERVVEGNPGVRPEKLVSVHLAGRNAEGVIGDEAFRELAADPDIVDMVSQAIGPDIILWGCQAFCKPGGDGMEVPWHQDGHYWPIRPLATCTVWVAIDDSTVENRCLRVIEGSHRGQRLLEHERDDREGLVLNRKVVDRHLDTGRTADVELEAGQMSLHDVYLVHGSNANRSPRRRAGVAIRYMPASSYFDRDLYPTSASSGYVVDFATRPLWLLRGEDRTGRNDFRVGHRIAEAPATP
jgi:ectoine hydroxylase-related dioxygenase (phytanoyl-CoA dioxygenase family)